ncbi:MAG: class IV adenylate cyclase [Candidatus Azambacteria bacterium]|nr:class IV adenylate cyclase [Candidatus Azambacteria bacterium]
MRKEIEVKAKVANLDTVAQKLLKLGCALSEPLTQNDTIFVDDKYGPFEKFQPDKNLLRIRESQGKFLFTLKQPKSNQLDCIERETEILNPQEMKEVLLLMGYHEAVQVHKVRIKTNYNNWEICLDKVEGLGSFIEVEKICEDVDAEKIQNELFAFLQTLDIKPEDRIYEGYDTLVYLSTKTT